MDSAQYIAGYIMSKITGPKADEWYTRYDPLSLEEYRLEPEYARMSLRPAIAREWFDAYKDDIYPHDRIVMKGKEMKPPKYYDKLMALIDGKYIEALKLLRQDEAALHAEDQTYERLATREQVTEARLRFKRRTLE